MSTAELDRKIQALSRPDPALLTYYLLVSLVVPPLFPLLVLPLYFRYHTMRYRFTEDGISKSWGILFRREIILNYARIQDIHLHSNFVERWLGLAQIQVQTASGGHSADLVIEGIREFEELRDFLYSRMRGVKEHRPAAGAATAAGVTATDQAEVAAALRETARELRAVREALAQRRETGGRPDV
jgi:uncharacterized protein